MPLLTKLLTDVDGCVSFMYIEPQRSLMDKKFWREAWNKAQSELQELRDERNELIIQVEEIDKKIIQQEALVDHIAPFIGALPEYSPIVIAVGVAELSLANAIREILNQSTQYRTARGIRDSLQASGYDLSQHNNALASIHGVLKRMADSGEIEAIEMNGSMRYRAKMTKPITGFSGAPLTKQQAAALEAERRDLEELKKRMKK
jgi:hypothetical protein